MWLPLRNLDNLRLFDQRLFLLSPGLVPIKVVLLILLLLTIGRLFHLDSSVGVALLICSIFGFDLYLCLSQDYRNVLNSDCSHFIANKHHELIGLGVIMGLNCRDWTVLLKRVVVSPIYDKFASEGMWFRQPNI